MTEAEKAEIEAAKDMLASPGWATLVRDTQARIDEFKANAFLSCKTPEEFYFLRGVVQGVSSILNYANVIEAASAAATADEMTGEEV